MTAGALVLLLASRAAAAPPETPLAAARRAQAAFAACSPAAPKGEGRASAYERCARARTDFRGALARAKAGLAEEAPAGLAAELERLEARQQRLEEQRLARPAPRRRGFSGEWTLFYTPRKASGACAPAPGYLDSEKKAGALRVEADGAFLFFAGDVSIAGGVDEKGGLEGVVSDAHCGEGKLSGRCGADACDAKYEQGKPGSGESGELRLAR